MAEGTPDPKIARPVDVYVDIQTGFGAIKPRHERAFDIVVGHVREQHRWDNGWMITSPAEAARVAGAISDQHDLIILFHSGGTQ